MRNTYIYPPHPSMCIIGAWLLRLAFAEKAGWQLVAELTDAECAPHRSLACIEQARSLAPALPPAGDICAQCSRRPPLTHQLCLPVIK